ncbi:MAG: cation:proton antiporter [Pseudomonadota bacterium]
MDWSAAFIWIFSLSLIAVAVVGKFGGAVFIRENWLRRIVIGMAMVPRGEVGLIFAELGRISGIFNDEVYAGVIIVIAYTTLFAPFWIKWFYRRYGERMD